MNNNHRRFLFQNGGFYHIFYRDMRISAYESKHSHSFYQCTYVRRGRITQIQTGMKYYQVAGEVFLSPPGCEHSLYTFANDTVYYCISFSETLLEDALSSYPHIKKDFSNIRINYSLSSQRVAFLDTACKVLMEIPESGIPYERDHGYHIACAVVIAALADAPMIMRERENDMNKPRNIMNAAIRYLEQFYYEDISIDDIADKFGFKRGTFCNRFIERTGISPKKYITEKRIHEAMLLIDTTELPFNVIAERVGYNDFSTFYRNFLRMTQKTPSEYKMRPEQIQLKGIAEIENENSSFTNNQK